MTLHRFATALLLLNLAALAAPAAAQTSSDTGLTGVHVAGGEYSQTLKFYGDTPLLLVASDIPSVRVTPQHSGASARVSDGSTSSTDSTVEVDLSADYSGRITVRVTAQDGTWKDYPFGVTRLAAPTTLSYTEPADVLRVGERVSLASDFGGLGGGHGTYADAYSTTPWTRRLPEGLHLNPNTGDISGTLRLSHGARTVRIVAVAIPGLGVKAEAEIAFPEVVYETSATPTAPDAPAGVNVTAPGGNFVVRWNPPLEDNGAEVTGYTATATPAPGADGATATCESDGENTGGQGPLPYCYIRYDALTDGAYYDVTVTATNSAGTSGSSEAFRWIVPGILLGGPGAPTLMAVSGDATVTLSWTPGDNGGNAVVKWQYRQIGHGGWTDVPDSGPGGENEAGYTVTGLTNGIEYAFKVRAVNAFWGGDASVARAATPLAPAPSFDAGPPGAQSYTAGHDIADLTLSAASGGTGTLTYTLTGPNDQALADAVPGLSFNDSTRVLSRTPREDAPSGRVVLTYRVTDSNGEDASQTFPVTVYPPLTLSAPTLTWASNRIRSMTLPGAAGGRTPRTYTLTGPNGQALDEAVPGLSFNSISALLRGTPTVPAVAKDLTYTATDTNGATVSATLTMTVAGVIVTEGPTLENGEEQTDATVAEDAGDVTYKVRLTSQPTNDVTASVGRLDGPADVVEFPGSGVTFTASNWDTPQELTVTIVNNGVANADSEVLLVFRVLSFGDSHYSAGGGSGTQALTVTDVETVSVPLKPTLSAADGENTVRLSWVSGGNGGSPIVKYQHRYREEASTWPWAIWRDVPDSNPNSDPVGANAAGYTVPYLASDVLYFFQVRAVSEAGIGNTSGEASATSVRSPPAELSVADASVAESDGATLDFVVTLNREPRPRALVFFNFATQDGTATAPEDYTAVSERVRGDRNVHSKTDHEDGSTTWTISVPVVNDETDEGSEGETLTLRLSNSSGVLIVDGEATGTIHDPGTGEAAAAQQQQRPPAPTLAAEAGDGQVRLSWTSGGDGGSAITNWRYRQKKASASRYGAWTDIPDSAPGGENVAGYTVTGLANGTKYTFKVRAVNALGDGVVSEAQTAAPVGAQQRPPAATLVAEAGDGQVTLSWTSGGDGGSAIAKWRYRQKKAGSRRYGAWTDIPDSAPGGENVAGYTVTGLANGTAYTFKVRAVNALGDGIVSVAQTATPVAPVPGISNDGPGEGASSSPPIVSVEEARVKEGPGAELVFNVKLDRSPVETARVHWVTDNGLTRASARAGEDYVGAVGTLVFRPGQTSKTIRVEVLDDSHDEGDEVMFLYLTGAENAVLDNPLGRGTIENSDPMPQAWLARFGRTASDHVVEAIADRWRDGERQTPRTHFTLGGRQVDKLFGGRDGIGGLFESSGTGQRNPALEDESAWARMDRLKAEALGPAGGSLAGGNLAGGNLAGGSAVGGSASAGRNPAGRSPEDSLTRGGRAAGRSLMNSLGLLTGDLRDVLMGSSFFYSRPLDEDGQPKEPGWLGQWSAWGETAATRFSGADGKLSLNGEVATAILGVDSRRDRWLAGVTLSQSMGEGAYTHPTAAGGGVSSTLTSLNPYVHYRLNERTSLWGVAGYGQGGLTLTPEGVETVIETDMATAMVAFGGRGVLSVRTGGAGRFELALRSDALLTNTDSEAVEGLVGAQGATSRVRLVLEGSGSLPVAGGVLRPTLEAGLRHDDGDAETGAGLEVGGGLAYASGRFSVQVNARGLLAHRDEAYEEWGVSGSVRFTPRTDGRGLSVDLGSTWGAVQSGVESLWRTENASGLGRTGGFEAGQRFQAQLAYGFDGRKGRARWRPYLATDAGENGSHALKFGLKMTSGQHIEAGLEIGTNAREPGRLRAGGLERGPGAPGARAADASRETIRLQGSLRW